MNSVQLTMAVGVGGFLGAVARFWVCAGVERMVGDEHRFVGTTTVNLIGCFAIGVVTAWIQRTATVSPWLQKCIVTGLLGAFTTYSTFALDAVSLAQSGRLNTAIAKVAVQLVVGLALVAIGLQVGMKFFSKEQLP